MTSGTAPGFPAISPPDPHPFAGGVRAGGHGRDQPKQLTHLLTEHLLIGLYQAVLDSTMSKQLARIYTIRLAFRQRNQDRSYRTA